MQRRIHPLLTDLALFTQTTTHHSDLRAALQGVGYTDNTHEAGLRLLHQAHARLAHLMGHEQTDTSSLHLVHTASSEVEMWLQTVAARGRRVLGDEEQLSRLIGDHLHGEDHPLTVMLQARRVMALLRADEGLRRAFGPERSAHDLLQRGHTLLYKMERCAEDAVHPEGTDARKTTEAMSTEIARWLDGAHKAAERAFPSNPYALGLLGVLPASAAPLGGTAGSVTLHARSSREAPAPIPTPDAAGWSQGRQGRNSENRGKGYA